MAYVGLQPLPSYDYEDQGQFGTCVGNGEAHILEYEALKYFPSKQLKFSPLMIYYHAKLLEGNWDEGTDPVLGWKGVMQYGVCLESDYPYSLLTDIHNIPAPSATALQNALQYKIKGFTNLSSIAEIDQALANGKAVNVGTLVTTNFVQAQDQGFIDIPQGQVLGGHDYVIFAVDDELTHTFPELNNKVVTGFYYIQNSWNRQQILKVAKEFIGFHFDFGANILECAQTVDTGWVAEQPAPTPVQTNNGADLIELYIDNVNAYIDSHQEILPVAPHIENDYTMIPLRFVSEHMGYTVDYDNNLKKITLKRIK